MLLSYEIVATEPCNSSDFCCTHAAVCKSVHNNRTYEQDEILSTLVRSYFVAKTLVSMRPVPRDLRNMDTGEIDIWTRQDSNCFKGHLLTWKVLQVSEYVTNVGL